MYVSMKIKRSVFHHYLSGMYILWGAQLNQLFINNEFIASKSTDTMDVINPATGEKIDTITFATEAEVNDAVEKSKQAQL